MKNATKRTYRYTKKSAQGLNKAFRYANAFKRSKEY